MIEFPIIIAVAGKGGAGKTVVTTLITKVLITNGHYKLLLIDADPTHPHLSQMVKLLPQKTLEQIRSDAIETTLEKKKSIQKLADNIDYEVYNALSECKYFSLFSIGQPEGPGCFCPSNSLLRKVIESISKDFEIVLIDCEAGLEQINRMVIEKIDILLIVVDNSLRSVETALSIKKSADKFTHYKKIGIILNKAEGDTTLLLNKIEKSNLNLLAIIPEDSEVKEFDLVGKPLIEISKNSKIFIILEKLVEKLLTS